MLCWKGEWNDGAPVWIEAGVEWRGESSCCQRDGGCQICWKGAKRETVSEKLEVEGRKGLGTGAEEAGRR
jgi:hypothetical protein